VGKAEIAGQTAKQPEGTFLFMDDEPTIRDAIGAMIRSLGYNVVTSKHGRETIDFLLSETKANRKIIGVLLDLNIVGGMGGEETVREIRKLDGGERLPVFATTGYTDHPVMADPKKFGFTASIEKPFRMGDLKGMLERYLG
jgi:CheY-like chemotaxis protein